MRAGRIARGERGRVAILRVEAGKSSGERGLSDEDWQDIFGRLQTRCGYTPREAREMTLPEYYDLAAFWSRSPPNDVLLEILARLWGWKPPPPQVKQQTFQEAIAQEGDMFRGLDRWFAGRKA
jgi:hypothetical protein